MLLRIKLNRIRFWGMVMLAASLLAGCSKDPGLEEVGMRIRFMHTSPDANAVTLQMNGENAFANALSFADTTAYKLFAGGTYNLSLAEGTRSAVNTVIDFTPGRAYSIFAVDSSKNLNLSVVEDDLSPTSKPLRSKIRFLNTSRNAGALSLIGINGIDTIGLFGNRTFNEQAESHNVAKFTEVRSGDYKLLLIAGNTITATLPSIILQNEKIYTILAVGSTGITGTRALKLVVLPHN